MFNLHEPEIIVNASSERKENTVVSGDNFILEEEL